MNITKEKAIRLFGGKAKLARALNIKPSAVTQWKDGKPIPELRAYQIRELKPEAFS